MPVISIVGCRMFEDEMTHLLNNCPEIEKVIVLENNDCSGIQNKMLDAGIPHKILPLEELPKKQEERGLTLNIYA